MYILTLSQKHFSKKKFINFSDDHRIVIGKEIMIEIVIVIDWTDTAAAVA